MASITVILHSLFRHSLGMESISVQAGSVEEAVLCLDESLGPRIRESLEAQGISLVGGIRDYGLVLLNGTNIRSLDRTDLKDGDVLHVFPRAIGG